MCAQVIEALCSEGDEKSAARVRTAKAAGAHVAVLTGMGVHPHEVDVQTSGLAALQLICNDLDELHAAEARAASFFAPYNAMLRELGAAFDWEDKPQFRWLSREASIELHGDW